MIPADTLIVTLGLILLMAGIALTFAALRGRLLNTHPHCRCCAFDLIGLDIDQPTPCPECGKPVRRGTASVRIGRRQRRRMLLAVGAVMLLGGATGLAWPKLSQIPSIKNFDWYAHFPEPLLLRLEAGGDKDALAELHSRLIPGTLSDEGLQTLTDRSLAMLDDESVPWDERWGDVLLYALVTHKMDQVEQSAYLEGLYLPRIYTHERVSRNAPYVQSELIIYATPRGYAGDGFQETMHTSAPVIYKTVMGLKSELDVEVDISSEGQPVLSTDMTTKLSGGWYPSEHRGFSTQAKAKPYTDQRQIDFAYRCTMRVLLDGELLHQWSIRAQGSSTVIEGDVEYADPLASQLEVRKLAQRLMLGPVRIPSDIIDAIMHEELHTFRVSSGGIQVQGLTPVGLAGQLCFLDGGKEIPYADCISIPMIDPDLPRLRLSQLMDWGYRIKNDNFVSYGLDELKRDSDFWKRARKRGKVDVVYRPDPSMLFASPRIKVFLDQPVIFRDMPLVFAEAYQIPGTERWGWQYRGSVGKEQHGELYSD